MHNTVTREPCTRLVSQANCVELDLFGPTVQFLVPPQATGEAPCVMKGIIPAGGSVPVHRHPGVEAFYILSGQIEVLSEEGGEPHWIVASAGDFIEVPSNAKHGFRNKSDMPVAQLITTTSELGRFFQEIGRPLAPGEPASPPSPADMERFVETAGRYGYCLASPEENAAYG